MTTHSEGFYQRDQDGMPAVCQEVVPLVARHGSRATHECHRYGLGSSR